MAQAEGYAQAISLSALDIVASLQASQAILSEAEYAKDILKLNARMAEIRAGYIIRRGEIQALQSGLESKQLIGKQKAAAAAAGVVVGTGSASEAQDTARFFAYQDALQIKANAYMDAMALRQEASIMREKARLAGISARNRSLSTLLIGGINAIGTYIKYKPTKGEDAEEVEQPEEQPSEVPEPPSPNEDTTQSQKDTIDRKLWYVQVQNMRDRYNIGPASLEYLGK